MANGIGKFLISSFESNTEETCSGDLAGSRVTSLLKPMKTN